MSGFVTKPAEQVITGMVAHPGVYESVNLNGWKLVSAESPKDHQSVLLGYRVAHVPEVWIGVGHRDSYSRCYWLGPRGVDPHYTSLFPDQVVIWREYERPICFSEKRPETGDYLQYRYLVGEQKPAADAAYRAIAQARKLANLCAAGVSDDRAARSQLERMAAEVCDAANTALARLAAIGWLAPRGEVEQVQP